MGSAAVDDESYARALQEQYDAMSPSEGRRRDPPDITTGGGGASTSWGTDPYPIPLAPPAINLDHNNYDSIPPAPSPHQGAPAYSPNVHNVSHNNNHHTSFANERFGDNVTDDEEYARRLQLEHDEQIATSLQTNPAINPDTTQDAHLAAAMVLQDEQRHRERESRRLRKGNLCCCGMELPWWLATMLNSIMAAVGLFLIAFIGLKVFRRFF